MSTSLSAGQAYMEQAPVAPPAQGPAETERTTEKFDTVKAVNYSMANLGASVFYGLFNFGMPLYLDTYNLHPSLIGLLANERSLVGAFAQPVVGFISDRIQTPLGKRRPFFLIGIPLVCLGLLLLAFHPPFWAMFAAMSVLAFFLAVAWDPYMAMMADIFPSDHRGRVGGLVGLGTGLGNIVFALLALQLWANAERLVFMMVIGVMIVTWGYTFFTVKEPRSQRASSPEHAKPGGLATLKELMQFKEASKYTGALLFWWLGTGGVVPFITLFGMKALGVTEAEVFLLPLAAVAANALFAVPAGFIADRTSKKAVMMFGMIAFGLVALVGSQSQNLMQGIIALSLAGAANACLALINPMLTDLVPQKWMATSVGAASSVFSLAQPLGSVVAGAVVGIAAMFVGENDAFRWAFITAGIMTITSALLLSFVHPERVKFETES
jgi:maltose/moltooligosaccharide transporter